jgi:BirA family biotin operon repressor/biotin-[acetyl-CoA-carboxylase] ligase
VSEDRTHHELLDWPDRLGAACGGTRFTNPRVVRECASTQDVARELGIGAVVATGRQRAGRGQLGRDWSDENGGGIAISFAVQPMKPALGCTATVLAVLDAIDQVGGGASKLGAKFPNDVVVEDGRKVAGVLVEMDDSIAVIGIGINVGQWEETVGRVSLEALGVQVSRMDLIEQVVGTLDSRLCDEEAVLTRDFGRRDLLLWRKVRIGVGQEVHEGTLEACDPFGKLVIRTRGGVLQFAAAQVRVLEWT